MKKRVPIKLLTLFLIFTIFVSLPIILADHDGTGDIHSEEATQEDTSEEDSSQDDSSTQDDNNDILDELEEEYKDEQITDAGITPDSAFYFIDEFFDRFQDEIEIKEEKIAEIKEMIEKEDYNSAIKALRKYRDYARRLVEESDPNNRDAARKSAAAIKHALNDIKDQIPEDKRKEFFDDILENERGIITGIEISTKIKELCSTLSELDPLEYSKICKTDDNAPKWQKKLHEDLTKDQQRIAKEFVEVMKECFKTSGQDCRCQDIPFPDFADACSIAAPLAIACEVEENELACDKLDNLKMPELPDYLQDIFDDMEDGLMEAQFDLHMPRECTQAGATTPKECAKIMIQNNAPEECQKALLDANVRSESEGRKICEEIMMKIHAPDCAAQGITNPDDCKDFMFTNNRGPRECEDNGITDIIECQRFMEDGGQDRGRYNIDFSCQDIEDATKRLDCYDRASNQAMGFRGFDDDHEGRGNCLSRSDFQNKEDECKRQYGEHSGIEPVYGDSGDGFECPVSIKCVDFSQGRLGFDDIKDRERECANSCSAEGGRWDFSYGDCQCFFDDYNSRPQDYKYNDDHDDNYRDDYQDYREDYRDYDYNDEKQSNPWEGCEALDCQPGYYCEYGSCISDNNNDYDYNNDYKNDYQDYPYPDDDNYQDYDDGNYQDYNDYDSGSQNQNYEYDNPSNDASSDSSSSDSGSSDSDSGGGDSGNDGSDSGGDGGITGGSITTIEGNGFLDYFFD